MALFPRRIVQRELDLLRSHVLRARQIKHLLGRLNSGTRHALAAEWEVIILGAFSRQSHVQYEPEIGEGRPDLLVTAGDASSDFQFVADIVTVSDFGTHQKNPAWYFYEKAWDLALKVGVDFS